MADRRSTVAELQSLEILGISEEEGHIYCWLLSHPGSTLAESCRALSLTRNKARRLLGRLETKGLATHSPEHQRHYIPVSPDIAIKALINRRQEELDNAHSMVAKLQRHVSHEPQNYEQIVEIISSREVERHTFRQMFLTARHEVVVLTRPPIRVSRLDDTEDHKNQREARARGVRIRSIIDTDGLALPSVADRAMADMNSGEEIRSFPQLPFKMVLVDQRLGIVPLVLQEPDSPSLLIHSSALLDALYGLFEMLWKQSAPLSFGSSGAAKIENQDAQLPKDAEKLITLLAAGMNDKRITGKLGISSSTFSRRIVELMNVFNARTRFQLGWLSANRDPERKK